MDVLVLCSANICRSPMAEAILRNQLDIAGIADVQVSSAGFLTEGREVASDTLRVLGERGVPVDGLTLSRRATGELLGRSDLIVCMAREHVREAVVLNRYVFGRTFTLKELVRLGSAAGARWPDENFDAWLTRIGGDRSPADYLGEATDDDVDDPIGAPVRIFRRTYKELDGLIERTIRLGWPLNAEQRELGEVTG